MSLRREKTGLDRRINDLEKELRLVQGDIKSLTRAVHDPRGKPIPRLKTMPPSPAEGEGAPESGSGFKVSNPFKSNPKTSRPPQAGHVSPVKPAAGMRRSMPSDDRDSRFATYLSAKGVRYDPPGARKERNVQRNKAIAMILIVLIVLYVVIQLTR